MRRLACALAAVLLIAPALLRLAEADGDAEALRCAIACGHAAGSVEDGAACCPMAAAPRGLAMSSCPESGAPGAIPLPHAALAVLPAAPRPVVREETASPLRAPSASPREGIARPPDHVPLLST